MNTLNKDGLNQSKDSFSDNAIQIQITIKTFTMLQNFYYK